MTGVAGPWSMAGTSQAPWPRPHRLVATVPLYGTLRNGVRFIGADTIRVLK
ncbi:hypothetical protein AB0M36_07050 [Actinoplanes sp. NPDC051346]|uniref:hypothetical protein n=1 Tax=Actinoplanes sp. NPDC051346 TaxID=3155048 RepID=UPI00343CF1C4